MKCRCDIPAAERTVVKETASKGRRFWTCGNNSSCHFFEWIDGPSPVASGSRQPPPVVPAKRAYTDRSVINYVCVLVIQLANSRSVVIQRQTAGPNADSSRQCKCNQSAVQRTVAKEGPNKGRVFWVCPNPQDADSRCDFFEWDDEPPRNVSGGNPTNGPSQGAGQSNGECYKVLVLAILYSCLSAD